MSILLSRTLEKKPALIMITTIILLLILAGCSGADVLNFTIPAGGFEQIHSLTYGDHPRQQLDVYRPDNPGQNPVVVFFYGGRWQSGNKEDYYFVGQAFSQKGYVTVIPDYRLYPDVQFPTFLEDGAQSVKWVQENITRYGGDPEQVILVGHSAGAYISVMLAVNNHYFSETGMEKPVKGAVGIAGPYDFLPLEEQDLQQIFGSAESIDRTQPIYFAGTQDPPLLLLASKDDNVVDPGNTRRLSQKIRKDGGKVVTRLYEGLSHVEMVSSLAYRLRWKAPTLRHINSFVQSLLPRSKSATDTHESVHPSPAGPRQTR